MRIKQMYVSQAVSFFKQKLLEKYNLISYRDRKKPVIFNGLYTPSDYHKLIKHKSHKTVIWCGTDAMRIKKHHHLLKKAGTVRHIAKSTFISKTLDKYNIKHIILPITPSSLSKNYKEKGECIYSYTGNNRLFYGGNLIDQIKGKVKYKIIEAARSTFTSDKVYEIYEKCFMGLRLTKHDGLPNTVLEMGLMGRSCVHNGNIPNALPYTNLQSIIDHINDEYKRRHENSEDLVDKVYEFLNIGEEWLNI